jgi:hypothetical protein
VAILIVTGRWTKHSATPHLLIAVRNTCLLQNVVKSQNSFVHAISVSLYQPLWALVELRD